MNLCLILMIDIKSLTTRIMLILCLKQAKL